MGLRRTEGSRSKQQDSDERRHIFVHCAGVRESGMRLPSEMGRGWVLSVAVQNYTKWLVKAGNAGSGAKFRNLCLLFAPLRLCVSFFLVCTFCPVRRIA